MIPLKTLNLLSVISIFRHFTINIVIISLLLNLMNGQEGGDTRSHSIDDDQSETSLRQVMTNPRPPCCRLGPFGDLSYRLGPIETSLLQFRINQILHCSSSGPIRDLLASGQNQSETSLFQVRIIQRPTCFRSESFRDDLAPFQD